MAATPSTRLTTTHMSSRTSSSKLGKPAKVRIFERKSGKWKPLSVKGKAISFKIEAAGGAIVKFAK